MQYPHPAARPSQGLSAAELIIVTSLIALLAASALASYRDFRSAQALRAAAALLETDIHFARSLSLTTGKAVRLEVLRTGSGGSCYLIHLGPAGACDCSQDGPPACDKGIALLRSEHQAPGSGVAIHPLSNAILFDSGKGTISPSATIKLHDAQGRAIHQVVNILGRVRSCTPGAATWGLPAC